MAGINTGDKLQKLGADERLGMHRDSEYLGAEDIDPKIEPVLTIEALWWGDVTLQRGKEKKDVISFKENTVPGIYNVRPLIINATNRKTLKKLYGGVTSKELVGKRIQLYIDHRVRDPQDGGMTDGVRIRPFAPKSIEIKCDKCHKPITAAYGMTPEQMAEYTRRSYGMALCSSCATEAKNAAEKAKAEPAKEAADETNG